MKIKFEKTIGYFCNNLKESFVICNELIESCKLYEYTYEELRELLKYLKSLHTTKNSYSKDKIEALEYEVLSLMEQFTK